VNCPSSRKNILEEAAIHRISASGPKWADRGGSALPLPSKIKKQHSSIINSSTYHADGDKWADRSGSALPSFLLFKIFILLSRPFA
jgi:hypothetical protein